MTPTFSDIKDRIAATLEEAAALDPASPFWVSRLWRETLVYLDFVRELSDAQLQFIRIHTSLITGQPWFSWGHEPLRFAASDAARAELPMIQQYVRFTDGLPERYWADEPAPSAPLRMVGLPFRGRLISDDLVRYQRAVTNLFNAGLLRAAPGGRRRVLLEIGAGYGGLAQQLRRMIEPDAVYVIVDLPEMLFWSAVFLRVNDPARRIYLYDPRRFAPADLAAILASHDVVLLPHYLIERLPEFPAIDVAINTLSMQEMPARQVHAYCSFLTGHLEGWFYSENFARHLYNDELTGDLYDIFTGYFATLPNGRVADHPQLAADPWRQYAYLATPKQRPAAFLPLRREIHGSNYSLMI
jgi:hypothetical protein